METATTNSLGGRMLENASSSNRFLALPDPVTSTPLNPSSSPAQRLQSDQQTVNTPDSADSKSPSRHGSLFPSGDFRNLSTDEINDIKCEVMANWLHSKQEEKLWTSGESGEGVVLKRSRGIYTCAPADLADQCDGLFDAVQSLNVKVAMTVNTRIIQILLHCNVRSFVEISDGLRVQVLPSLSYLQNCQKHQFAAFIADLGILVVWDDEPDRILNRIEMLESVLVKMIWEVQKSPEEGEDAETFQVSSDIGVEESHSNQGRPRRIVLMQPLLIAATLALTVTTVGAGWRQIAIQVAVDGKYPRIALVMALLPQIWLALFFFQALVGNIAQVIGPISQMKENTKYYSGIQPSRLLKRDNPIPHVTIQCPVYKEGLKAVIEPTIRSLEAAISTYEMQGGTANIFINDDGMQLMSDEDAHARQEFYEEHNIGWVSRPKHNPQPMGGETPFYRRGKFKKASNMNYALWVSQRIEDKLSTIKRHIDWTESDETAAYHDALSKVLLEDGGRTWAEGDIRMGDYILLVDSDTRVPADCLLDAVSEMEQSPQVAIMQYSSGVMNVTDSFFERGITYFTHLIYTQIRYAVANGDVAPFVGHNAILRWLAIQQIAYDCPDDNREKYWSESTVSEDFDMALRLQTEGYLVRLAAYTGDGFKEGVSLTVYDELARWEKYAYGCSELIFHPLHKWATKGPITPLFWRFLTSNMPLHSKLTILSYIGTYYAIGSSWILSIMNYFVVGWYNGHFDHYYIDSFKIFFAIIVVFTAFGNMALAFLRYRTEERSLYRAVVENFKWVPLLIIFLGGISLHVSQAILSHLFGIEMIWGATSKEAENITFFEEIPRVIKRFKWTFALCFLLTGMMIVMATIVPYFWQIDLFIAIFPLGMVVFSHFTLPIALNPNLMLFTW